MSKRIGIVSIGAVVATVAMTAQARTNMTDEVAVRRVIEESYVSGVFISRDEAAVRRGFHKDFVLSVLQDEELIVAPLEMWLERLELDGVRSNDRVTAEFDRVDVTGRTAVVKLRLMINSKHVYTDYMGLYRFPGGWRIVNKVYEDHD